MLELATTCRFLSPSEKKNENRQKSQINGQSQLDENDLIVAF